MPATERGLMKATVEIADTLDFHEVNEKQRLPLMLGIIIGICRELGVPREALHSAIDAAWRGVEALEATPEGADIARRASKLVREEQI